MLPEGATYKELRDNFIWDIPDAYNIGVDVCDRWASDDPGRTAIIHVDDAGRSTPHTFAQLRDASNRLANLLTSNGIARGDRIAVLLPQCAETAISHIAGLKLGAIMVPLFTLFGPDALQFRLADSGARAVITDRASLQKLRPLLPQLPALTLLISIDGGDGAVDFRAATASRSPAFEAAQTKADDPAFIIYTSGTTGPPKGALHAHRVLLGHLPGVEISHDLFPQAGDLIWTPADWAWIGGLLDVLMPALHHGVPVAAHRFKKFTGEAAFAFIERHAIRNAFLPPTALKIMRAARPEAASHKFSLRTVASGGESLGGELIAWGQRVLGVTINEFYGQTECNMIVSSSIALMPPKPGAIGKPVPGHDVSVIDGDGRPCAIGEPGQIAARCPDPVMFLGYWNNPQATAAKFRRSRFDAQWLITGDQGVREPDGFIRFIGRDDDIITSSGYRIGPGEIEDCLLRHPAVKLACAVGKPDPTRTQIVKAYVVLNDGWPPSGALAAELSSHVRDRLAAHEYPRELTFVDDLPMTTTGKIIRRLMRDRAARED
jgi:acetyl-CoA synthetase